MQAYFYQSETFNPWQNLAVEKYLAGRIREGDILLYLWRNDHTVVIGKGQNALRECRGALLEEEGGYLARRTTGGGAVYHDLGNLCFTFAASPEVYDLERQMEVVREACRSFGIGTRLSGRNDIVTEDGRKFSGNAFSVSSSCRIQHGTLMVDVDRSMMARYLTPSKAKLQGKGVASVRSRVCNLKEIQPDLTTEELAKAMLLAFEREYAPQYAKSPGNSADRDPETRHAPEAATLTFIREEELDQARIRELTDHFASWEWRYGKSPQSEIELEERFPWGEVQVHLSLSEMKISECKVYSDSLDVLFPGQLESALLHHRYDLSDLDDREKPEHMRDVLTWLRSRITEIVH